MLMIALAGLIVVSQYATTIDNESKPILEAVVTSGKRRRQSPHHHFHERRFGKDRSIET